MKASNERESHQILRGLALKQAVINQLPAVITAAAEAVLRLKPDEGRGSGMMENQIRNVVNVATEAKSIVDVTNFIRYQIGRSNSDRQWQYNRFGQQVIEDIEDGIVEKCAQQAAELVSGEIEKRGGNVDITPLCGEARLILMQQYLGYLNRKFSYCDKMNATHPKCWENILKPKGRDEDV
jgi:hypothetical protein